MKNKLCYIVYRGPLERSRLAFILDSIASCYHELYFIWIFPGQSISKEKQAGFDKLIGSYPAIKPIVIHAKATQIILTTIRLKEIVNKKNYDLICVGTTAPFFTIPLKPTRLLWFINGIPEERLNCTSSFFERLLVKLQWNVLELLVRPDLIVTVSKRMSNHIRKYFPLSNYFAAPTCVDLSVYKNRDLPKKYFSYLGSGAPWQALDLLSEIWQAIHSLDATIHFRVISRDERTQILAAGISDDRIHFVASENFDQVADFLSESEVGFLIREDILVNRVSFPTKMAEYLASGCWIVSSDIDWDIADYLKKYDVGILVRPNDSPNVIAQQVLNARNRFSADVQLEKRIIECTDVLKRPYWVSELTQIVEARL